MTTVTQFLSFLPKKINQFDLITETNLDILTDKQSFINLFQHVPQGWLDEVLISYDKHYLRYSLRVKERGEQLYLEMEYMKILFDEIGPFSAQTLEKKDIHNWDFENTVYSFLEWVQEHSSN